MQINGFNKTTLLDYPKHLAATIFVGGCNMRCPFCHNASLVLHPSTLPVIPSEEVLAYLNKRRNILEGVCITGGEPTLYKELPDFINDIRLMGYKVKLDTNGTNPSMLKKLVAQGLIDYVAMDIKNSRENYSLSVGIKGYDISNIEESAAFLLTNPIDYEFRTTVVRQHHTSSDFISIGEWLKGAKSYYLQAFRDSGELISEGLSGYSKEAMLGFVELLKPYIDSVSVRGID